MENQTIPVTFTTADGRDTSLLLKPLFITEPKFDCLQLIKDPVGAIKKRDSDGWLIVRDHPQRSTRFDLTGIAAHVLIALRDKNQPVAVLAKNLADKSVINDLEGDFFVLVNILYFVRYLQNIVNVRMDKDSEVAKTIKRNRLPETENEKETVPVDESETIENLINTLHYYQKMRFYNKHNKNMVSCLDPIIENIETRLNEMLRS